VVGVNTMAGDPFVAATMGTRLFGANGDLIIRLVVLVSLLSGLNSNVVMAPRIPLAMSRDGLMPPAFDTVNQGGTPVVAHWTSIGLALGFILSGTVQTVLALAAFFFVANYTLSFVSVFAMRRNEPATPRPFRVPGFPYTTGIVLLGSLAFLVGAVVTDSTNSTRSLLLLAASYPMYRVILKWRS
jgi:APA family basic amino acid/polyamine antiporter